MNASSFALTSELLLENLLNSMEEIVALEDLDMDIVDGVLTLEFDDRSKIIINRQEPVKQIWLASPEGPAHFSQDAESGQWLDIKSGDELYATLSRVLGNKTGEAILLEA